MVGGSTARSERFEPRTCDPACTIRSVDCLSFSSLPISNAATGTHLQLRSSSSVALDYSTQRHTVAAFIACVSLFTPQPSCSPMPIRTRKRQREGAAASQPVASAPSPPVVDSDSVRLFVKTLVGKTLTLHVDRLDKVEALLRGVELHESCPRHLMTLHFAGQRLTRVACSRTTA